MKKKLALYSHELVRFFILTDKKTRQIITSYVNRSSKKSWSPLKVTPWAEHYREGEREKLFPFLAYLQEFDSSLCLW